MTEPAEIGFSVLIPNYNYARYIGETIESVLTQAAPDLEIVVTDNASTDASVEVVRAFQDARVRLSVNPCNVGFSSNLERVAGLARGRRMLLLSSDDRMKPGALAAYDRLETALGDKAQHAIWGSSTTIIDGAGVTTGRVEPDPKLWRDAPVDPALSRAVGFTVRSMPAAEMLRRSLEMLRSPLPFASTCYPKALHDAVGGYAGGRLMNPDKWFLWKLLAVAEMVYVIDEPLFEYRVHDGGQNNAEARSGALKHLTDQYISTFNVPDSMLAKATLDRESIARAFVEHDIALRGLVSLSEGKRLTARRMVHFGLAAYPDVTRKNPKVWALRALLRLGPVGTSLAKLARARVENRWKARASSSEQ
ncbi:MAG: glycosyltransferase [Deltaproteobacteria bacterium]|nr:glycosyltransferase [Deltaproteobacteria bacterium]